MTKSGGMSTLGLHKTLPFLRRPLFMTPASLDQFGVLEQFKRRNDPGLFHDPGVDNQLALHIFRNRNGTGPGSFENEQGRASRPFPLFLGNFVVRNKSHAVQKIVPGTGDDFGVFFGKLARIGVVPIQDA